MAFEEINNIIGKLHSKGLNFVGKMRLAPYAQRGPRHDFVFMKNTYWSHSSYFLLVLRITTQDDIIATTEDQGHWSQDGLFGSNYLSETYVTK